MKKMVWMAFAAMMWVGVASVEAQPRQMRSMDFQRSAKEVAREKTAYMERELGLSKRQVKELYDLHYARAKAWQREMKACGYERERMHRKWQYEREELDRYYRRILNAMQWAKWERIAMQYYNSHKHHYKPHKPMGHQPPRVVGGRPKIGKAKPYDKGRKPMSRGGKK